MLRAMWAWLGDLPQWLERRKIYYTHYDRRYWKLIEQNYREETAHAIAHDEATRIVEQWQRRFGDAA